MHSLPPIEYVIIDFPDDWNTMPGIEHRRIVNMYLNALELYRLGLNDHFNPRMLVQPPPPRLYRKRGRE